LDDYAAGFLDDYAARSLSFLLSSASCCMSCLIVLSF
jgi:hypothetical protein